MGTVPDGERAPLVRRETLEVLLEEARGLQDDEDRRADSLLVRAARLAGFAGVTISLLVAFGGRALVQRGGDGQLLIGGVGGLAATIVFVLGLALLACGAGALLLGVMLPRAHPNLGDEEVAALADYGYVGEDKVGVQGRLLRGYVKVVLAIRAGNDARARWLERGSLLLALGLLAVVATAIVAVLAGRSPGG